MLSMLIYPSPGPTPPKKHGYEGRALCATLSLMERVSVVSLLQEGEGAPKGRMRGKAGD